MTAARYFRVEVGRPGSAPLKLSEHRAPDVAQRRALRASTEYRDPVFVWMMVERQWGGYAGLDSCEYRDGRLVRDWRVPRTSGADAAGRVGSGS